MFGTEDAGEFMSERKFRNEAELFGCDLEDKALKDRNNYEE